MGEHDPEISEEPNAGTADAAGDDVVDEYEERPIDRLMHTLPGAMTGAAITGLAKGMGLWVEPEEVAVIREAGAPPRDPDDPIDVQIDLDHPEKTRVVYHVSPKVTEEPGSAN